jgi:hypothetical protein
MMTRMFGFFASAFFSGAATLGAGAGGASVAAGGGGAVRFLNCCPKAGAATIPINMQNRANLAKRDFDPMLFLLFMSAAVWQAQAF